MFILLADQLTDAINGLMRAVEGDLQLIGIAGLVVGIVVGGLLRVFAYGNERRIHASNVALSCAVIGFIIVMLGPAIGNFFQTNLQPTPLPK